MPLLSMKDHSKIIEESEKLPYEGYVKKRPKHEPTDSHLYLARHIAKCMMRADAFNLHVDPVRTEITGTKQIPISHICWPFFTVIYTFPTDAFWSWTKFEKYELLYWDVQNTYMETS